jgi:hypothetical protein
MGVAARRAATECPRPFAPARETRYRAVVVNHSTWPAGIAALLLMAAAARGLDLDGRLGRWSVQGYAEGYAVIPSNDDTQRQRPAGIFDLNFTGRVRPNVRAYLEARTIFGGTPEHADGFGVVNLSDVFQNISPSLEFEEGYVDVLLPRLDLRIGKQKFAWGRLDTFQPTDVINPRRYTDPFLTDEDDAKIGVPALRASYFPPDILESLVRESNLTLIWVPVQVPERFPTQHERWFPPAASVPPTLEVPAGLLGAGLPAVTIDTTLHTENARPPQLDGGAAGVRLAATSSGVDWSLVYYDGPETAPSFDFTTAVFSPSAVAGQARTLTDLQPLHADATLRPRFARIHLIGGDAAFQFAGFTARAEAAYGMHRLLPRTTADLLSPDNIARAVRPQLATVVGQLLEGQTVAINLGDLFVARDTVEWGAGVDYPYRGWAPVLQVNQTVVLHNATKLLINDIDTHFLFALRKSFFAERLPTELVAVQGIERSSTSGIVRVTYVVTDNIRVRVGYLLLAGSRRTVIGQYHDRDEAFMQVWYAL